MKREETEKKGKPENGHLTEGNGGNEAGKTLSADGADLRRGPGRTGCNSNEEVAEKRSRATAIQDALALAMTHEIRESVMEMA
jgi:hypothetical protein